MPTMPKFEMPTFDVPKFEMPKFEMPNFEMPKFEMPKFEMPKFDVPTVDLPSADQVVGVLRDAAYAGAGLVALTAERIAELQAQLVEVLKAQIARVGS